MEKNYPPINCRYTDVLLLSDLRTHPKNPNKHSEKQIRLLALTIKQTGWRNPIVVSKRSGYITKGHCRLEAAKYLKLETAPVEYQNYESDAAELADMIADNKISELSEMDNSLTLSNLETLENMDILPIRDLFIDDVNEENENVENDDGKLVKYGEIKFYISKVEDISLKKFLDNYKKENGNYTGIIRELLHNGANRYGLSHE